MGLVALVALAATPAWPGAETDAPPQHFELAYFSLNAPPGADWNLTSERTASIWFMRLPSDREYTNIGVLKIAEIDQGLWLIPDPDLAKILIDDYRQAAINGGHGFSGEEFDEIRIGGKLFYAGSARITTIHKLPVDEDYAADEMIYVHIAARRAGVQPDVYVFLFSDFRHKSASLGTSVQDFLSVLESFDPKDPLAPV
jgi:hypothetical protein